MKKKELLKLPVPPLTTTLVIPDRTVENREFWDGTARKENIENYIYTAFVDSSTGEQVLIFDLYHASGGHIRRHFQTKNEYFSITAEGKLSKSGLDMALLWYGARYYCDKPTGQIIHDFLSSRDYQKELQEPIRALSDSNRKMKEVWLKERYDKIRKSISDDMLEIRPLPKVVEEWARREVMKSYRYIFYRSVGKKNIAGHCSWCGKPVEFERVKDTVRNEAKGKCPHCKSEIIYKAIGSQSQYSFSVSDCFCYLQPVKDGFCARGYKITRSASPWGGWTVRDTLYESARTFYRYDDNVGKFFGNAFFVWGNFRNSGNMEWCRADFNSIGEVLFFPNNLNELLKHPKYGAWHTDLKSLAKNCGRLYLSSLLEEPRQFVVIGHLVNAGLYKLAGDVIRSRTQYNSSGGEFHFKAKSLKEFGISKNELPFFQRLNPSFTDLKLYNYIKATEGNVNESEFAEFASRVQSDLHYPMRALERTTLHQLLKYIVMQDNRGIHSANEVCNLWLDYLDCAESMGYTIGDPSVKFPKALKAAHDATYKAFNNAVNGENGFQIPGIALMEDELNKRFYFETKKFLIRAPHDHKEIIAEGEKLYHCVARYAADMARRNTIILFIRKKEAPDIPYYTLELNPKTLDVLQCKGFGNNTGFMMTAVVAVDKTVLRFVEKWKKEKVHHKEEKLKTAI